MRYIHTKPTRVSTSSRVYRKTHFRLAKLAPQAEDDGESSMMSDYHAAMLSEQLPPMGMKRLDKLAHDQEMLSGITNPIKSPLHEDALPL